MRADAQRNRDRIVEVARQMFRERGYDVPLDDIAKSAGVGPGTLYRHFPNRDALLDAVMQSWMDRVTEATDKALAREGSDRDFLLGWFETYVALISMHKGGPAKITQAMGDETSPIMTKCQVLTRATQRIVDELKLTPAIESTVWESLALSNLMIGLAINRRYTYQSIGALGVIELTAPSRVSKVNDGLARLGLAAKSRAYYLVHASLDVAHSASWNREVILPLVQDEPARAAAIAEGALLRLRAGARCFRRYRAELWNRPAVAPLTLVAGNERQARPRDGMVARRN